MKSRTRWISIATALPALIVVGTVMQAPPAHAGFGSKLKKKLDKVTGKSDEASRKVDEATDKATAPARAAQDKANAAANKATAPAREAQGKANAASEKATRPVREVQNKARQVQQTPAQMKAQAMARANAMKAQLNSAARLTDKSFAQDAALKKLKIDALPSPDGKTLRLIGTVSTAQQKMRAGQLALRNYQNVANDIKIAPKAAPAAAKAAAKAKANQAVKKATR